MAETKDEQIKRELLTIMKEHKGVLRAEAVVAFAENPKTALHSRFQWQDDVAAREYRLWQAREIIRVVVTIMPNTNTETRAYVSLQSDRKAEGGGYRNIGVVMSDEEMRAELLGQALGEFRAWQRKYEQLTELAGVFAAAKKAQAKVEKKQGQAKQAAAAYASA